MIRTLIIDDEPLAASVVEEYLSEHDQFDIVGVCTNGFQGLKSIQELKPDLIFLDVQMPKITGFEMLELVEEPPAVIFTTAFDEYAVKAFDAKAIDYLLKPFSKDRFAQAIQRFEAQKASLGEMNNLKDVTALAEKTSRIVVRVKNEIKVIATADVVYFEAQDDYVAIHTDEGKFLKKMTLKSLQSSLSDSPFVRSHRSYLVNMNQISKIEPYEKDQYILKLKSGSKIPVSKSGYTRLRQVLGI